MNFEKDKRIENEKFQQLLEKYEFINKNKQSVKLSASSSIVEKNLKRALQKKEYIQAFEEERKRELEKKLTNQYWTTKSLIVNYHIKIGS